ncbi:MAG: zinc ribbon domain-containing protein, partial [Gemmatimonadota bacterium]
MSENVPTTCPRCGTSGTGNFCANCGAALGAPVCTSCGVTLTAGAKFCHKCGTATGVGAADRSGQAAKFASPADAAEFQRHMAIADASLKAAGQVLPRRDTTPWIVAGVAVIAIISAVAYSAARRSEPTAPNMANAGNSTGAPDAGGAGALGTTMVAPNIDSLSPKERFLRLQNRIDQKIESKDTTRVTFLMQMALQAYGLLTET